MWVTKERLDKIDEDEEIMEKLLNSKFSDFFFQLSRLQESLSQQAQDQQKHKARVRKKPIVSKPTSVQSDIEPDLKSLRTPSPPSNVTTLTSTAPPVTPQNKRIASDGSTTTYDIPSTDSTPQKLDKAEQEIQSLQNTLVMSLIKNIWNRRITVPWVRNRKMWIDYVT